MLEGYSAVIVLFYFYDSPLMVICFFFMHYRAGLMLRSEEIGAAAAAWPVGLFGIV